METYLVHFKKGAQKDDHKYIDRIKKNGKWYYTYYKRKVGLVKKQGLKKTIENNKALKEKLQKLSEQNTNPIKPVRESVKYYLDKAKASKFENYEDAMKLMGFKKKTEKTTKIEDQMAVNPNYPRDIWNSIKRIDNKLIRNVSNDDDYKEYDRLVDEYCDEKYSPYQANCYACSITYDLRRRGWDVTAVKDDDGEYTSNFLQCYNDARSSELYEIQGKVKKKELIHDIQKDISSDGEGARGFLGIYWTAGGAHSVVYEVGKNGNIVIRDCQNNEVYDSLEDYCYNSYGYLRVGKLDYTRVDNLTPNGNVITYVTQNDFLDDEMKYYNLPENITVRQNTDSILSKEISKNLAENRKKNKNETLRS